MDQQKSSTTLVTKRVQISLILFCAVGSIVFILINQLVIAKEGESITCKKSVYLGGPLFEQPSRKLTLNEGQKAVCLDEQVAPQVNNCLVYSFGIRDDWYFEESMENQECNVSLFKIFINSHHNLPKPLLFSGLLFRSFNGKGISRPFKTDSFLPDDSIRK